MVSENTCKECGKAVPPDSPRGFCGRCLLRLGLVQGLLNDEQGATGIGQRSEFPGGKISKSSTGGSTGRENGPSGDLGGIEKEGDRINRYRLLQEIGHGGCGVVYLAEQLMPVRRDVALKVIKVGMDTKGVVARFEAERQALALMDHPNIAKVLDGGATKTGRPYFVMELVRGLPITEYCDARKLTLNERIALVATVCQAVQHAHQKGVIHRDLKPSNILVADQDGHPAPKVLDFGIAKATHAHLTDKTLFTEFNQIIGTPAYMSPEQAGLDGLDVDSRSDVFSLGVVLYRLLVGTTPFETHKRTTNGLDAVLKTIREGESPKPSTRLSTLSRDEVTMLAAQRNEPLERFNRALKGDLDWIVLKAIEKDRNRRYETASAFAADLIRFLRREPVVAAPPSISYQLTKFAQKHRTVLATGVALAVVLIGGIIATTIQALRATRLAKSESMQRVAADRARIQQRELLYASEMAVSFQALDLGQVQRVRQILEEQRPGMGEPDLRGWEWRYLWAKSRPMESEVLEQPNNVTAVRYSPDGSRWALGYGGDGGVRVYDAKSNRLLADKKTGVGIIDSLAFTPTGDGLYLGSRSTNFLLLDSATLDIRFHFVGHQQRVAAVVLDPRGELLVSAAGDHFGQVGAAETFIWDAREKRILFKLPPSSSAALLPCISASGRFLSRGLNQGGMVEVWDLHERRRLIELKAHKEATFPTAFSPDEAVLATGGDDGFVRLWNWRERQEIATLGRHMGPVSDAAFSPDGRRLATCGLDGIVRLWDVEGLKEQAMLRGHNGRILQLAFSPDGTRVASAGGPDQSIRFWDATLREPETLLDKANESFATAGFSTDAREYGLLRVNPDGSSSWKLWRMHLSSEGGNELISSALVHKILSITLSTTNLVLMAAGNDEVFIQDPVSGQERRRLSSPLPLLGPIAASPDGRWLAAFAVSNHVVVWDAGSGAPAAVFQRPDAPDARPIAGRGSLLFSPNGSRLWVLFPGAVSVACVDWQARDYPVRLKGHTRGVLALAASADGTVIATGATDMTARLWDAATGTPIAVLRGENGGVTAISMSPDGLTLATGHYDGQIKLWSALSKTEIVTFNAHKSIVQSVLFSPDGRTLASASYDGTTQVWQAPLKQETDAALGSKGTGNALKLWSKENFVAK